MIAIKITDNDVSKRIDNFILKCYPNLLKTLVYKLIRTKKIKVNKKRVEINYHLQLNDEIEIYANEDFLEKKNYSMRYEDDLAFLNASDGLSIIYENDDLLIVNKPVGMLSHSSKKNENNTLIDQIKKYLYKKQEYQPELENSFAPALSNRLDRNTSGLVIASKNYRTLKKLNESVETKEVKKFYYTYAYGKFEQKSGIIKNFLYKDENRNIAVIEQSKTEKSKIAILKYRVINYYSQDNVSMLEIELLTGRFHQIRAQLANANHPLVGDGKYYDPKKHAYNRIKQKNQILVAYKLIFSEVLSGFLFHINDEMTFQIPDIYKTLKNTYKFK